MGIIKKQSIQGTIILYIGVFIGFVTTAILFPRILKEEEIGLINTLLAYSIVFAQFATLGFKSVITRMFSYFRNYENRHNNFFFLVFSVLLIGSIIVIIFFFLLKETIINYNIKKSPLFVDYIYYLIPLVLFTLYFYILDNYYTVLFKSVRGIFLKEFLQRVFIVVVLALYYWGIVSLKDFIIGYIVALSLPAIILIFLLIVEGEFVIRLKVDFISKKLAKTMFSVALFGILTSVVGSANIQIDKAMSSSMLGLELTGIYSTVLIFPLLIKIPSRALLKISSAIIAEAWKRNDIDEIKKIYKETSFNQYIIALLVLIGLWANIDNIFILLPEIYISGKYIILILGIAYTFEMATGAAGYIIATSKYYKYLTWFVLFSLISSIISNLIFIPLFGLNGVAIATAITISTFTLLNIYFIYLKFKIQPFNIKFLYVGLIGFGTYFCSLFIIKFDNFLVDIAIRSVLITIMFFSLIMITRVSPQFNVKFVLNKIKDIIYRP